MLNRLSIGPAIALACLAGAAAQQAPERSAQQREPSADAPCEGFWPTERMVDLFIDRATEEMRDDYDFDEDQLRLTRELFKDRLPRFMKENRPEIQHLMNQFFEAQLAGEAPSVEDVTEWAQRAMPLIGQFREVVQGMTNDMREYLTDDQQIMLDANAAAFEVGIGFVSSKVANWAEGNYDPETEWPSDRREREERDRAEQRRAEAEMEAARQAALESGGLGVAPRAGAPGATEAARGGKDGKQTAQVSPKDEWEQYVADFIKRYELDREQAQKAQGYLRNAQQDRDAYLRKNVDKIAGVRKQLEAAAENEEARKDAQGKFDQLNAPVERIFAKLKENLDTLPRRSQRAKAAKLAAEARQAGKEQAAKVEETASRPPAEP